MDLPPPEVLEKMQKIVSLSMAIQAVMNKKIRTVQEALELQYLVQQRKELLATLPPIRAVT